jgi:hypothetical protein
MTIYLQYADMMNLSMVVRSRRLGGGGFARTRGSE